MACSWVSVRLSWPFLRYWRRRLHLMQRIHTTPFGQLFRLFSTVGCLLSMFVVISFVPSKLRYPRSHLASQHQSPHNAMSAVIPNGELDALAPFRMAASPDGLGVWAKSAAHMGTAVQRTPNAWNASSWKAANCMCVRPTPNASTVDRNLFQRRKHPIVAADSNTASEEPLQPCNRMC